jgi:hypothetical protein
MFACSCRLLILEIRQTTEDLSRNHSKCGKKFPALERITEILEMREKLRLRSKEVNEKVAQLVNGERERLNIKDSVGLNFVDHLLPLEEICVERRLDLNTGLSDSYVTDMLLLEGPNVPLDTMPAPKCFQFWNSSFPPEDAKVRRLKNTSIKVLIDVLHTVVEEYKRAFGTQCTSTQKRGKIITDCVFHPLTLYTHRN